MVGYDDTQYNECFLRSYLVSYLFMVLNLVTTFFLYFGCNVEINKLRHKVNYLLETSVENSESASEEEETETETASEEETEEETVTESESEHEGEAAYSYLKTSDLRVIGEGIKKMVRRCYSDTATYLKPLPSTQKTASRIVETSEYKFKNY